jgi:ABC-2 type transport system ATP-binding protein
MEDNAITVEHVSKNFKLPHEKTSSIKGIVTSIGRRNKTYEIQEALKDINFTVKKGEFFGIVGRNGSGKSTLLKLLAGIYTPTKGLPQWRPAGLQSQRNAGHVRRNCRVRRD